MSFSAKYHLGLNRLYNTRLPPLCYLACIESRAQLVPKLSVHYAKYFRQRLSKTHPRTVTGKQAGLLLDSVLVMPLSLFIKTSQLVNVIVLHGAHHSSITAGFFYNQFHRLTEPYRSYLTRSDFTTYQDWTQSWCLQLDPKRGGMDNGCAVAENAAECLQFSGTFNHAKLADCLVVTDPVYRLVSFARALEDTMFAGRSYLKAHPNAPFQHFVKDLQSRDPRGFSAHPRYAIAQLHRANL